MQIRKRKVRKEDNKLTKARVLRKFVETFGLKLEKISPLAPGGGVIWRLVRDRDSENCPLYAPNSFKIYTFGSRTVILDYLLNDIPWWYEKWQGPTFANPLFGCKSLEEAMLKLDLIDSGKPKK